jgi:broad specificity phosphatase PhoE
MSLLTSAGEEQARAGPAALAEVDFDRVITSGLRRTTETARIVAPGCEPESWPELRELRAGHVAEIAHHGLEGAFTGKAGVHQHPRRRPRLLDRAGRQP